eukprot:3936417-Rhodomonas_salina.3
MCSPWGRRRQGHPLMRSTSLRRRTRRVRSGRIDARVKLRSGTSACVTRRLSRGLWGGRQALPARAARGGSQHGHVRCMSKRDRASEREREARESKCV